MAKTLLQKKCRSSISAEHAGATASREMRNAWDISLPMTAFDMSNTEILNRKIILGEAFGLLRDNRRTLS